VAAFESKTIVITGASEGIGRALALALAPQRANLVLAARSRERLDEAVRECEAAGARALAVPTDVTDPAACKALVDRALAAYGGLDVLVCNAGRTMWARLDEITDLSIFERLMRLNYLGGVYCTYHALPHLKRSRGLIVGVASVAGLTGVPCRTAYSASKHAQFGFFDSLRIELAGTGVDVTTIAPDFVVTEIHRRALKGDGSPLVQSPIKEGKVMSAAACAALIVDAMEHRRRLVIGSLRGKVGRWARLLAPQLTDLIARRAIESGS
jgi:NAD(P)-dependent dehydrogenase (short-subunit alcohol dehydrogenase family)